MNQYLKQVWHDGCGVVRGLCDMVAGLCDESVRICRVAVMKIGSFGVQCFVCKYCPHTSCFGKEGLFICILYIFLYASLLVLCYVFIFVLSLPMQFRTTYDFLFL